MPEIRHDPVTGSTVIISPERGFRPIAFSPDEYTHTVDTCPFCPGREERTPPEIMRVERNGKWIVRVVPNKFPAVVSKEHNEKFFRHKFYRGELATGYHEVVIETPDHFKDLADQSEEHLFEILRVYRERYRALIGKPGIRYVHIFRNWGKYAGASLPHPHTQILALRAIPEHIKRELEAMKRRKALCRVLDIEVRTKERLIMNESGFVAIAPFGSRFSYESWIVPSEHESSFGEASDERLKYLAKFLLKLLKSYRMELNGFSYNLIIHSIEDHDFHWHIEILPRLVGLAGFEVGTGYYINTVSPETAAEKLRKHLADL